MNRKILFPLVVSLLMLTGNVLAQHEHHESPKPAKDTAGKVMDEQMDMTMDQDMSHLQHSMQMNMTHAYSRNLPMSRNGSGTSWLPDASPMYMYMTGKKTSWMFHGNIFLRYTNTDIFNSGDRGRHTIDAPNWFMTMMNKPVGHRGLFSAKAMISLDALTEGKDGYPLLFQSGETYHGKPLVDRQHPHDLFSELSIAYSYAINKNTDVFVYAAYPGEPALGAPAFMHRVSAMNNPDAPLGHHWQDATHITFGVATIGFRYRDLKIEGSSFTGREPGENRYNFDEPRFDSYSYRLSYNPSQNWAFQFSQGFINEPERLEPGIDVTRTTASVLFSGIKGKTQHDAALIWGYNDKGRNHREHSLLLEDNARFGKNVLYGRYEFVQKSTEELDIEDEFGQSVCNVHAITGGYNRSIWNNKVVELAAGSQVTINFFGKDLQELYGNTPVGFQVYLQLRPALHRHNMK